MRTRTDRDHDNMDVFLGHLLEAHKAGELSKEECVSVIAHVVGAVDRQNLTEARASFDKGYKQLLQSAKHH